MNITKMMHYGSWWGKERQVTELKVRKIQKARSFLLRHIPKNKFNVISRHINKRGINKYQPSK